MAEVSSERGVDAASFQTNLSAKFFQCQCPPNANGEAA